MWALNGLVSLSTLMILLSARITRFIDNETEEKPQSMQIALILGTCLLQCQIKRFLETRQIEKDMLRVFSVLSCKQDRVLGWYLNHGNSVYILVKIGVGVLVMNGVQLV